MTLYGFVTVLHLARNSIYIYGVTKLGRTWWACLCPYYQVPVLETLAQTLLS